MAIGFSDIPEVVIDYIRGIFAAANDKVSLTLTNQPSFHEPFLDSVLVGELSAAPPAFFAAEQIGLEIETHFLGSRWMEGRFEIADIAFSITLRQRGHLELRKVALLQTKRLYSREIAVPPADPVDFEIGIGRLIDRPEPSFPLSKQRQFKFDETSTYDAISAGSGQIERIGSYMKNRDLPVYYGLYNPLAVPFSGAFPPAPGANANIANSTGFRILPAADVHAAVAGLKEGQSPSFKSLTQAQPLDTLDSASHHGWRLERFVADEVLRCRQGKLYDSEMHPSLYGLLYERSAPITAAIAITIDFGADAPS